MTRRLTRSTKPCGPGTPTLVSSFAGVSREATEANKPGTPRRARNKSSNIARGMPACVRLYLWCFSCAFLLRISCTRGCGCNGTRHSLRPPLSAGDDCGVWAAAQHSLSANAYPSHAAEYFAACQGSANRPRNYPGRTKKTSAENELTIKGKAYIAGIFEHPTR